MTTTKAQKPAPNSPSTNPVESDPAMQGEGNVTAARRHRQAAEAFVASGQVDKAARKAAPPDAQEAAAQLAAEQKGLSKAKK